MGWGGGGGHICEPLSMQGEDRTLLLIWKDYLLKHLSLSFPLLFCFLPIFFFNQRRYRTVAEPSVGSGSSVIGIPVAGSGSAKLMAMVSKFKLYKSFVKSNSFFFIASVHSFFLYFKKIWY